MSAYEFTKDWFSANLPDWKRVLEDLKPRRYLEIGSFEGMSACVMLECVPSLEEVVCVDSWEADPTSVDDSEAMKKVEARFERNIKLAVEKRKIAGYGDCSSDVMKMRSHIGLTFMLEEHYCYPDRPLLYDLIYIDGSHHPEHCLQDMVLAFQLLRTGGVMIVDDYLWATAKEDKFPRTPKLAVDAFTTIYWPYLLIIPRQSLYQIFIQKVEDFR